MPAMAAARRSASRRAHGNLSAGKARSRSSLIRCWMRSASAEPPISTKPFSAGCCERKLHTFSVFGGSKGESFFDVFQNSFYRGGCAFGPRRSFVAQNVPFRSKPFESKFHRDVQEAFIAAAQECGANERGIVCIRIRPDETGMFLPKCASVRHRR